MVKRINQMMDFKTRQKFMRNLEKINLLDGINRAINKIMNEYEGKKEKLPSSPTSINDQI